MRLRFAKWVVLFLFLNLSLSLGGCLEQRPQAAKAVVSDPREIIVSELPFRTRIHPNIKAGDMPPEDTAAVSLWIDEAVALMQSPEFESNFRRASELYPELFVSQKEDLVPSETVLARLQTGDPRLTKLWWPETHVTLTGESAVRSSDLRGFGFEASRIAGAGPMTGNPMAGEITLGRLHLARYTRGDAVEKSCALNTMVHEISHTLSDQPDQFWMHILDSEKDVTPPKGVFEASYFIGTIAQCTYLQSTGHILSTDLQVCMMTFSDPASGSRFKSLACNDFPNGKPITPQGRLSP